MKLPNSIGLILPPCSGLLQSTECAAAVCADRETDGWSHPARNREKAIKLSLIMGNDDSVLNRRSSIDSCVWPRLGINRSYGPQHLCINPFAKPERISYSTSMDWMGNRVRCLPSRVGSSRFGRVACTAGFSLIELLIVAALILVLSSLYWESGSNNRQRQLRISCQQNLQKIYMALQIYANDNTSSFPVVSRARTSEEALSTLVPRYTVDRAVFICPGSKDPPIAEEDPLAKQRVSYAYYMGRRLADSQEPLLSDRQVNADSKAAGDPAV